MLVVACLQAPLLGGVPELLRTAVVTFNIDPCFHEPPSWHVVVTEVSRRCPDWCPAGGVVRSQTS